MHRALILVAASLVFPASHIPSARAQDFAKCNGITAPADRLACFDALAKPSTANDGSYTPLDIVDFKTDRAQLRGKKVEVRGLIMPFAEMAILAAQLGDTAGVFVETANAPREDRRSLARCADMCRVTIRGTVGKVMMQDGIKADRLVFN